MKLFVSYTTRDKQITKELLSIFSKKLEKFGDVFIDIIHNNSSDRQARVFKELENSDLIILIESKEIYQSEWVNLEIKKAKSRQIPIRTVLITELDSFSL